MLQTDSVKLALTAVGGMLGPVSFLSRKGDPIEPYAIAPWAEEQLPVGTPPVLIALRGDWFCSAFGENVEAVRAGTRLPPHGETANGRWQGIERNETGAGCWLRLGLSLPLQGGYCESTTALLRDHPVIYQRHDLSELTGPCNPGHHATLAFPETPGIAHLSFSPYSHARTCFVPLERADNRGYSCLKPNAEIFDLTAVPCIDGTVTDLTRYPARRGFEDLAIVCTAPAVELGWSAVSVPQQNWVWFSLRNPIQLASTLLWFSNGGRHYSPWNGRHVNVLGIEDLTGFFHAGLAASQAPNLLNDIGVRTCLQPHTDGRISIPYIQGTVRTPPNFGRVAAIESAPHGHGVVLRSDSGIAVEVRCHSEFLRTGKLPGLEFS